METKKGLTKGLRYFYGIGDLCFTLMSQVQDVFFNFFLTNIALFSLPIATMITTVTTAIDAALSWIYGAIINGSKPLKWGRYRSWLLITPWIVPFIYAFKFAVVGSGAVSVIVIIAAGVISSIIWNFGYVANMALIPMVGRTPQDRAQLSATRATYNRAASMLFSYMGLPLANLLAVIVTEQYKFAALAFVLGIIAAVGYNIHFKLTAGYELTAEEEKQLQRSETAPKKEKVSAGAMAKSLFQNGPLLCLILAEMTRWMANFVILGCVMYYFTYVAQNLALLATYMLISNLICMIGTFTSKYLVGAMGTKRGFIFAYLLMGASLIAGRIFYLKPMLVILFMSIAQYGYGCIYSLSPTMFADAGIYAEWKTGEDASGFIMGLGNVPLKVALVLRGLVINGVLAAIHFNASLAVEQTTPAIMSGISSVLLLIPGAALLVGALILIFGFRLTKEQIEKMSAEIQTRKTA